VLRQPVKWDPTKDPIFEVPSSLTEEEASSNVLDETWLQQRRPQPRATEAKRQTKEKEARIHKDVPNELDLFQRTLDTLDYPIVLEALQDLCTTVPARRLIQEAMEPPKKRKKKRVLKEFAAAYQPLTAESLEGIQERYGAVEEMQRLLDDEMGLMSVSTLDKDAHWRNRKGYKVPLGPPPLKGMSFNIDDIINQGLVLEGPELLEIVTMLDVLEDVSLWSTGLQKYNSTEFIELPRLAGCIQVNVTLQELLHNAFDNEGRLSGTTFPTVGKLRSKVKTLKSDILSTLETLLTTPSISTKLALESGGPRYAEVNGRIVIPIDQKYSSSSLGIIHDASRSGKTIFVEPTEIVGATNELRQAEAELRAEEARVWRTLTASVLENLPSIEGSIYAACQLDLVMARVQLGRKLAGVIPQVGNEGIVCLHNAKHPVLLLRELDDVVGSDIDLGAHGNQGLVLTGPNSGGKTVILKLLGLVALMARNGIPVPASPDSADYKPRVDFFSPVLADIGDLQSVGGDLSTFSGHMLVCREVLANSGKNALVLMDELGSGTDPRQGVAIAQALLEALLETGARVAITTHYLELKQLAASDSRFSVGGMQFVGGRPTYKLLPGTVGESFALAVAERLKLPDKVISRAMELLDEETKQMGDLIRDLEDQKALIDQQAAEIARKKQEMASLEVKMKREQARLEQKQLSARRDEAQKFAKMLEDKERILEDVLEKLKSDPSRKIVANSWNDIKFVKRDALNEAENIPSVVAAKKQAAAKVKQTMSELVPLAEMREKPDLAPGDKLIVCKKGALFGKEATILEMSNRPEVQVNGMAVRLKMSELSLPTANYTPPTTSREPKEGPKDRSKAAAKLIQDEQSTGGPQRAPAISENEQKSTSVAIRTDSNTVDVRGLNLEEARTKCKDKFSTSLMSGRPVVYILHGHGTSGVLKTKIRAWLKSERSLIKRFKPADSTDGGDAFTRVELR
jgi:DNA mismatch repair protein MutS2